MTQTRRLPHDPRTQVVFGGAGDAHAREFTDAEAGA